MADDGKEPAQRNGRLRVPLPFDDAIEAALQADPPKGIEKAKKARTTSRKRSAKKG